MSAPAGPFKLHPAAGFTDVGISTIPLSLGSGDVDLTSPTGPTGGYCARSLLIGGTAGNVTFYDLNGNVETVAVGAYMYLDQEVSYVVAATTTATPVNAVL